MTAALIYHGTPMTPRAALLDVGKGRAFCVSFFHPQDVEAVQEISPAIMFRQRRVFGVESCHEAWGRLVHPRGLDAVLSLAGAAPISSRPVGSDTRCTRCAKPAQRFTAPRMAVWSEGIAALAYGRADRSAVAAVRAIRPGLSWLDRRRQNPRHARISRPHGRSGAGFGQPMAGAAHDARHGGCAHVPIPQRGQHIAGAEWLAL